MAAARRGRKRDRKEAAIMRKPRIIRIAALAALVLAGGCTEQHGISPGTVKQTKFPGQLAAGGAGSGEIMQRTKQSTTSSMPSGTPGIPEGAGGTTSGPGMGGTTPGAAVAGDAPKGKMQGEAPVGGDPARAGAANAPPTRPQGESAGAGAAAAAQTDAARKAAAAQKEKEELVASMDNVARRWRADAATNNWTTHPATPVAAVAGISSSNAQDQSRTATPPPVRSEKQGDAAPSEDVKKPKEPGAK
jgi:hypothetical protein